MKLMNYYCMLGAAMACAMAFSSCSGSDDSETPDNPVVEGELPAEVPYTDLQLTGTQREAMQASNEFAVSLMKDVMEMQGGESTVVSPFSLYTALSMVANGDKGTTRDRILEALGFGKGEAGLEQLNDFNSFMTRNLPTLDSRAYALVSNSVWLNNSMRVLEPFSESLEKWYGARVASLPDLHSDAARHQINEWCADKTRGMIPEFLKENLKGDMALINATYFAGIWTEGFRKEATAKATFTNQDGTRTQVDMMRQRFGRALYARTDDATVLGLPYGNGNFRMMCVLPDGDISEYAAGMTEASLRNEFAKAVKTPCVAAMPKFDIGSRQKLMELLKRKGLECLENPGLDAISPDGNLHVADVLQEARVSSDEGGTTGAAVTKIEMDMSSSGTEPKFPEVTLDRPFMFLIEETSTGTILFMGAVTKL